MVRDAEGKRLMLTVPGKKFEQLQRFLLARSEHAIAFLKVSIRKIAIAWLMIFGCLAILRVVMSPTPADTFVQQLQLVMPYILVAASPFAGYFVGRAAITGKRARQASSINLNPFGQWKKLSPSQALKHSNYGPIGFLASLIIGMILNVVFRSGEFLLAIPALSLEAPEWGYTLFWLATFDTAIMNFFYMVCFVMALRTIPLFPKMLLYTWLLDVSLQLSIAKIMAQMATPAEVASTLVSLLNGNIDKVLLSAAIWLPYMMLSERVNVTFRHRVAG